MFSGYADVKRLGAQDLRVVKVYALYDAWMSPQTKANQIKVSEVQFGRLENRIVVKGIQNQTRLSLRRIFGEALARLRRFRLGFGKASAVSARCRRGFGWAYLGVYFFFQLFGGLGRRSPPGNFLGLRGIFDYGRKRGFL